MSDNKDKLWPSFDDVEKPTPEQVDALNAQIERKMQDRRAYVAEKIKTLPEGALPLEEKRALAGQIVRYVGKDKELITTMTEEDMDDAIVAAEAVWIAQMDIKTKDRRAYVAQEIKKIPEGLLPLEEKRVLVGKIFQDFVNVSKERIATMTEEDMNDVIVVEATISDERKSRGYHGTNGKSFQLYHLNPIAVNRILLGHILGTPSLDDLVHNRGLFEFTGVAAGSDILTSHIPRVTRDDVAKSVEDQQGWKKPTPKL